MNLEKQRVICQHGIFLALLIIFISIFCYKSCQAEDLEACMSYNQMLNNCVTLEQCTMKDEEIVLLKRQIESLEQKDKLREEADKIKDNIIALKDERLKNKDLVIEEYKKIIDLKDKQIEDAKPSAFATWIDRVICGLAGGFIGKIF